MILHRVIPKLEDLTLKEIESVFFESCKYTYIATLYFPSYNQEMIEHLIYSIENNFCCQELVFDGINEVGLFVSVLKFIQTNRFTEQQKESFRTKLLKYIRESKFMSKFQYIKLSDSHYLQHISFYHRVTKFIKNNVEYYQFHYSNSFETIEYHKKWTNVSRYDSKLSLYNDARKGLFAIDLFNIILTINNFDLNNDIRQYIKEYIKLFFDLSYLKDITFK